MRTQGVNNFYEGCVSSVSAGAALKYYSFGSQMPGRQYNNGNYRYGFSGKEKDDEIKGTGNSIAFEARIYDPRLGRWLSLDPLADKFPNESPYLYVGNSPIVYIDVKGKFKIPIHKAIMTEVMDELGIPKNNIYFRDNLLIAVGFESDILGGGSDYHFDGRQNFDQIQTRWGQINNAIGSIKGLNFEWANDVSNFGKVLHNVMDFYSHSNYVELYIQYYKDNNKGELPAIGTIPTYEDAMNNENYKGFVDNYLKDNLKTGEFNLGTWLIGRDKKGVNKKGLVHHDEMAKDNKEMGKWVGGKEKGKWAARNTHDYARAVAKKHVKDITAKKKEEAKTN